AHHAPAPQRRMPAHRAKAVLARDSGLAQVGDAVDVVDEHMEHGGIAARELLHAGMPEPAVVDPPGMRIHVGIVFQGLEYGAFAERGPAIRTKQPPALRVKARQELAADALYGAAARSRRRPRDAQRASA